MQSIPWIPPPPNRPEIRQKGSARISHAPNVRLTQQAAQGVLHQKKTLYLQATQCLKADLPEGSTFLQISGSLPSAPLRTTNGLKEDSDKSEEELDPWYFQ